MYVIIQLTGHLFTWERWRGTAQVYPHNVRFLNLYSYIFSSMHSYGFKKNWRWSSFPHIEGSLILWIIWTPCVLRTRKPCIQHAPNRPRETFLSQRHYWPIGLQFKDLMGFIFKKARRRHKFKYNGLICIYLKSDSSESSKSIFW